MTGQDREALLFEFAQLVALRCGLPDGPEGHRVAPLHQVGQQVIRAGAYGGGRVWANKKDVQPDDLAWGGRRSPDGEQLWSAMCADAGNHRSYPVTGGRGLPASPTGLPFVECLVKKCRFRNHSGPISRSFQTLRGDLTRLSWRGRKWPGYRP